MTTSTAAGSSRRVTTWMVRADDACVCQHRVGDRPLVPLAHAIAHALSLYSSPGRGTQLRDFAALRPLPVEQDVQVEIERDERPLDLFLRFRRDGAVHFAGRILRSKAEDDETYAEPLGVSLGRRPLVFDASQIYSRYAALGFAYGRQFRRLISVTVSREPGQPRVAIARLSGYDLPCGPHGASLLLDGAFQSLIGFELAEGHGAPRSVRLPVAVEDGWFSHEFPRSGELTIVARHLTERSKAGALRFECALSGASGGCVARVRSLLLMNTEIAT